MQSDPGRQWFIYFKEKEFGPIEENDVNSRYEAGEIDGTAYVYTEGMPDWTLLSEIPLFTRSQTLQSAKILNLPRPEPSPEAIPETAPVPAEQLSVAAVEAKTAPNPKPTGKARPPVLRIVSFLLLLVCAAGAVFFFLEKNKRAAAELARQKDLKVESPEGTPTLAVPVSADFPWKELLELRSSSDRNSPPFRLASKQFGNFRPILVGAVSPLLKAESLWVAVFPDPEKHLFALPRVWFLRVPLVDGLFNVGPLSIEGNELPPGTYHLMAKANSTSPLAKSYLGEITFDLGQWPSNTELNKSYENIQSERTMLSEKERASLQSRSAELLAASAELQRLGKLATNPKTGREWLTAGPEWKNRIQEAMDQQTAITRSVSFYPDLQLKILQHMRHLLEVYAAIDLQNRSGPRALKGKGLGQLWAETAQLENQLMGEIQTAKDKVDLKLDAEQIRTQLMNLK